MTRIISLLLIGGLFLLSGCECVGGIGRDLQKAGKWVEEKSEKEK